ncbi:MAG: hypothetical protein LBH17_03120, partial [Oscillospiraceae bacterium]|nr:hypothetical protein [Oscillospiraceae bacterium]
IKLKALNHSSDHICDLVYDDCQGYPRVEHLHILAPDSACSFCDACFTENYPVDMAAAGVEIESGN